MRSLDKTEIALLKSKLFGKTKLRTAIYARKSSEDKRQTSLSTQIAECKAFIKNYDFLELKETFKEDNVSGMFTEKRSEFQKMINQITNGELDVIVVMKLDRFARSAQDTLKYHKKIISSNGVLIAGDINCLINTPTDNLVFGFTTLLNQYFAERAASDIMASECNNARNGFATGMMPYGYKIIRAHSKDKPHISINNQEAPAIRLLFKMIEQGESYNKVIEELNVQGFKTRKGCKFCKSTINSMLRNEKYCGDLIYNRIGGKRKKNRVIIERFEEIKNENSIPAIIEREQFDNVQKILANKKVCQPKQDKYPRYILTGLIRCKCGRNMSGSMTGSKRIRNYICPCHIKKGNEHCDTKDINAEKLERTVKIILTEFINEYIHKNSLSRNEIKIIYENLTHDKMRYENKIIDLDKTIKNLVLQTTKLSDKELISEYQKNIKDLHNELQAIINKKQEKDNKLNKLNSLLVEKNINPINIKLKDIFYDNEISKKIIRLLISIIHIDNNQIKIKFKF